MYYVPELLFIFYYCTFNYKKNFQKHKVSTSYQYFSHLLKIYCTLHSCACCLSILKLQSQTCHFTCKMRCR